MRNQFALIGAVGTAMTLALSVGGCALAGDGDMASTDGIKVEEPSNDFAYAEDGADQAVKEELDESTLTAKGTWSEARTSGVIYHRAFAVPQGQTLTCTTSNGTSGVDTVLAIIRCYDPWNTFCWPASPSAYSKQFGFNTLAFNDDYSGLYSQVSFTATNSPDNVYVVGFAYGSSVGNATIVCNRDSVNETASFQAGSNQRACDQGKISTTSGGDTLILGIDPTIGGGNTRLNDDILYPSNLLSSITSLPSGALWYVHGAYSSGTSTLSCAP